MAFGMRSRLVLLFAAALVLAACATSTPPPIASPTSGTVSPAPTPAGTPTPGPGEPTLVVPPTAAPGTFTPGSVRYRVANLSDQPVDVYVRSQGLVEAFPVQLGLARGEVTDYVAPPDPGALLVTTAGAGDPTCVGTCPHFVGSWGNTNAHGDQNTLYVYDEGAVELWEYPDPADVGGSANALPPGDPAHALLLAIGQAVSDADFGMRVGFAGIEGCQQDVNDSGLLDGGTCVLPYAYDGTAEVLVYDNSDPEGATEPIGGPFAVSGAPGSRTLLLLYGSTDAMEALVVPIP